MSTQESKKQPKARMYVTFSMGEDPPRHYLFLNVWNVKHDPSNEVLAAQLLERKEDKLTLLASVAALRTADGKIKKLRGWKPSNAYGMGWTVEE